jgi:hypothetical protein
VKDLPAMLRPGDVGQLILRLLPSARVYFETMTGVVQPTAGRGRRVWVVSRGLCRFYSVSHLPEASRSRQLAALTLEIKSLSPFAETGSHIHFGARTAGIWLWDMRATRDAASAIGVDIAGCRVLPETALEPPGEDGVRIAATLDGVEGQCWHDNALVASRWWADAPDSRSWLLFQRGASVSLDRLETTVPPPVHLPWLPSPWTTARGPRSLGLSQIDLRVAAAAAAALILVAYGYVGAEWLRAAVNVRAVEHEIAARSQEIEPTLAARTQALDNLAAIRLLQKLDDFPSQLSLMAAVAEALPRNNTRLTAWTYDRGQLELDIAAGQPVDVADLVRSLEHIEHLTGVAAERTGSNNTLRLRATIKPL